MKPIKVKIKKAYGKTFFVPLCDRGRHFCEFQRLGSTSLSMDSIRIIKKLGYEVEICADDTLEELLCGN